MKFVSLLFVLLFFLLVRQYTFAENTILINEFLIEPTPQQVEVINIGTESADISGWYIDDNGGSTYYTIPQSSILYPNSCLVFSGDFNLNKSSPDTIRLFNNGNLVDSFSYKSSSGSGISYIRLPDGTGNWTTKSASLGMFNESGLSCVVTPTLTPTPTLLPTQTLTPLPIFTPTPTLTPTPTSVITPILYQNIYISEAMVNPPSGENEWVELFNNNEFSVSLIDWYIDDIQNRGSSPRLFSLEISAKTYGIIDISSSIFNNTGDSVRLLDFNKNRVDDFEYASTNQGKTVGRISIDSDEFCIQEPSKGIVNSSCINPTVTPNPTSKPTSKPTNPSYPSATAVITRSPSISINRYINTNNNLTPINLTIGGREILGASSRNTIKSHTRLIHSLSLISFTYSLLTILSLFLRMKIQYGKNR